MSIWPILLRTVISLGLVINGSAPAMASTAMAHVRDGPVAMANPAVPLSGGEVPCHSAKAASAPTSASSETAPAAQAPVPVSDDCCAQGACRCTCLHQAFATVPVVMANDPVPQQSGTARRIYRGHEAPASLRLIRPPIG